LSQGASRGSGWVIERGHGLGARQLAEGGLHIGQAGGGVRVAVGEVVAVGG
jgi:hypothetical protein